MMLQYFFYKWYLYLLKICKNGQPLCYRMLPSEYKCYSHHYQSSCDYLPKTIKIRLVNLPS